MTNHDLTTRMTFIRATLCDPRLSNRQQKMLAAVATYMPFDTDEGWILKTEDAAKAIYFGRTPTNSAMRESRRVLKELEDQGFLQRVYSGSRRNTHSDPTFFVNWDRLQEPYREILRREAQTVQQPPSGRCNSPLSSISTQEYPEAGSATTPKLRIV